MAILRAKEIAKMDEKTRNEKLKDLKIELIKANVSANRTNAKHKEIKRAIARLLTFNNSSKKGDKLIARASGSQSLKLPRRKVGRGV